MVALCSKENQKSTQSDHSCVLNAESDVPVQATTTQLGPGVDARDVALRSVYHSLWVLPPGGLVTRVEVCTFCILPSLAWNSPSEHGSGGCSFWALGVSLICKAWWFGARSL